MTCYFYSVRETSSSVLLGETSILRSLKERSAIFLSEDVDCKVVIPGVRMLDVLFALGLLKVLAATLTAFEGADLRMEESVCLVTVICIQETMFHQPLRRDAIVSA